MASDSPPVAPPAATNTRTIQRLPLGRTRRRISFEKRLRHRLYVLGLPLLALCLYLLINQNASWPMLALAMLFIFLAWAFAVSLLMEQIIRPLQTLSNVVAALREDDFSFRARGATRYDALGELALEINALASMMQSQRIGAMEAVALVERVVQSLQSPVLAFDPEGRLRLLNAAAEKAFAINTATSLGKRAHELALEHLLSTSDGELVLLTGQKNRWMVKRSYFRLEGIRHTLLLLSDVSAALREEERVAWERLIRVLGHEINNSLTPIKSIANSLRMRLADISADADFERGLAVIENRAESLNRFLQAYRQLLGIPVPKLEPVPLVSLIDRVAHLETRLRITVAASDNITIRVDTDLIQQALINLVRNAAEAAMSPDTLSSDEPRVEIEWQRDGRDIVIYIRDNGPGLFNESNLFVPFYTTKPSGTGIGLVLVQQIAEAHGGSVRLSNRVDTHGCTAELRLPN